MTAASARTIPLNGPILLAPYDPAWPALYEAAAAQVRAALGARVLGLHHVGSTSVPGLCAKPIIDMLLVVADSAAETAYAPALEAAGWTLRIREPDWFEHRLFRGATPAANLHVFSAGCPEIARMLAFRDRLRADDDDRRLYEETKRALAARTWAFTQDYADAKTQVVEGILARTRGAASFTLEASDGVAIAAYRSVPTSKIKGIVQIAHGMAEHFGRYRHLTDALTAAGYAVYANDHRGHGGSAGAHGLGDFGPGGFQAVVDDMAALARLAKQEVPGRPLALLGHSMGSFAAQLYLLEHAGELAALVLSGTAALDKLLESMVASGGLVTLELLNAGFEPARTAFDWLSRDEAQVDAYVKDPLCGFALEDRAMGSVFELGSGARQDARLARVRKDLPIYVISGERDPVTGPDQAFTRALIDSYAAVGFANIEHRVYVGGRHEMFNETCREQVETELIAWLDRVLR